MCNMISLVISATGIVILGLQISGKYNTNAFNIFSTKSAILGTLHTIRIVPV